MMFEIMKNEKSYDILPNFTAADIFNQMGFFFSFLILKKLEEINTLI
jgi:hypothetical protein